jgi:hypothetical protein
VLLEGPEYKGLIVVGMGAGCRGGRLRGGRLRWRGEERKGTLRGAVMLSG